MTKGDTLSPSQPLLSDEESKQGIHGVPGTQLLHPCCSYLWGPIFMAGNVQGTKGSK